MKSNESEVVEDERRRLEEEEKEWNEQKRKEREKRAEKRRLSKEAKATAPSGVATDAMSDGAALKDERKDAENPTATAAAAVAAVTSQSTPPLESAVQSELPTTATPTAPTATTAAIGSLPAVDEVKEVTPDSTKQSVRRPIIKRPRKPLRTFSASLSSPSTATSALHLSSGVELPPSFGSTVPSQAELMAALPEKALSLLPIGLFPPVVDFSSLTPELFLHRLRKKLTGDGGGSEESKEEAAVSSSGSEACLPLHAPLLRVSVYAPASERKQQEIILHGEQTLDELMAVIKCSAKHQPHPPVSSTSSFPPLFTSASTTTTDTATAPVINTEFLYIEHTLYPHQCTPTAALTPILTFLNTHSTTSSHYPTTIQPVSSTASASASTSASTTAIASATTATFMSLPGIRLGSHYLYHHAVDCCHIVIVDSIEFASQGLHVLERSAYPSVVWERSERRRLCGGCRMASATCCVYGDMLSDVEPLLLCDGCERLLHCDSRGDRLYDNYTMYKL